MERKILRGELATKAFAENFAKRFYKMFSKEAVVIGLSGDLGSGKTTFVQGFAKGLGIQKRVTSPTFVLMKKFSIKGLKKFRKLIHIDAYRLEDSKEILDLGWSKLVKDPKNIILVEWAEKIKEIFPKKYFLIKFQCLDKERRALSIFKKVRKRG